MRTIYAVLTATVLLLVMGGTTAVAAPATQIAPGVFADPNSPAAKEYALQLQQARSTGSSHGSKTSTTPALFGAGINPTSHVPARGTPQAKSIPTPAAPVATPRPATLTAPAARRRVTPAAAGGGGGTVALIGGAAAILVLGGVGGLLLRGRRPGEPSTERQVR